MRGKGVRSTLIDVLFQTFYARSVGHTVGSVGLGLINNSHKMYTNLNYLATKNIIFVEHSTHTMTHLKYELGLHRHRYLPLF